MAQNKLGRHTFRPGQPVYIAAWASVAGKKEAEGPLGHGFDIKSMDTKFGEKTWEQAEKKMQQLALEKLLYKSKLQKGDLDLVFSGALLNQCIGSSFTLRNTGIPHLGLYGACSTMAQSLLLAAMTVGGGYADRVAAMTSSHFAGSERQYRFPLGYGGQRTPTAQWTVTGSGAALVSTDPGPIAIESATIGTVTDLGVTDAANMGAAMAPVDVTLRPCGGMHWLHNPYRQRPLADPQNVPPEDPGAQDSIMGYAYAARARYRKVTICARLQTASGPKVVAVRPFAMPFSAAQRTASA